jgi:hypothetical protein
MGSNEPSHGPKSEWPDNIFKSQQLRRVGALVNPCRLSDFNPFLCEQEAVLPRCAVKGCAGREHAARAPTQRSWAAIVR